MCWDQRLLWFIGFSHQIHALSQFEHSIPLFHIFYFFQDIYFSVTQFPLGLYRLWTCPCERFQVFDEDWPVDCSFSKREYEKCRTWDYFDKNCILKANIYRNPWLKLADFYYRCSEYNHQELEPLKTRFSFACRDFWYIEIKIVFRWEGCVFVSKLLRYFQYSYINIRNYIINH